MSVLTFADLYSVRLSTSDRIKKNKENFEKEESMRKRKLQQQLHLNIKSHIINEFLINRSNSNRTNNNDYIVENDNYGKNLESNKSFNSYKKDFSSASSPHSIFNENEGSDKNKRSSVDDSYTVGIIPSFEWKDYLSKNSKVVSSDESNDYDVITKSSKKLSKKISNLKKFKNYDDGIDYNCYKNDFDEKHEYSNKKDKTNNKDNNSNNNNNDNNRDRDGKKNKVNNIKNSNKNNKEDDYLSNFEFTKRSPYSSNDVEKTEIISVSDLRRVEALEELPPRLVLAAAAIVILIEDKEQVISKSFPTYTYLMYLFLYLSLSHFLSLFHSHTLSLSLSLSLSLFFYLTLSLFLFILFRLIFFIFFRVSHSVESSYFPFLFPSYF